jgi:hypothetical protein
MKGLRSFVCIACAGLILGLVGCSETPTAGTSGSTPEKKQDEKKPQMPISGPSGGKFE